MRARCSLVVNGRAVRVATGDTPIEAAVAEGMIAPLPALHGTRLLGQAAAPAGRRPPPRRARGDAARTGCAPDPSPDPPPAPRPDPARDGDAAPGAGRPAVVTRTGTVTGVRALCPGVVEVVATLTRRPVFEPGHQLVVAIEGLPALTLSPTLRVDGSAELNEAVFHLPRAAYPDDPHPGDPHPGRPWASAPGLPFGPGDPAGGLGRAVRLRGPVGRAQYRPGGGRLVLAAAGAGFAPIWAIARAARYVEPGREVALTVGARDPRDLYMRESLDWLRRTGVGRIVLCAERARQRPPDVRPGPLSAHLPPLRATDVVHVAGDVASVGAVQGLAAAVGARCHAVVIEG